VEGLELIQNKQIMQYLIVQQEKEEAKVFDSHKKTMVSSIYSTHVEDSKTF
jgi:hypothetical protein